MCQLVKFEQMKYFLLKGQCYRFAATKNLIFEAPADNSSPPKPQNTAPKIKISNEKAPSGQCTTNCNFAWENVLRARNRFI